MQRFPSLGSSANVVIVGRLDISLESVPRYGTIMQSAQSGQLIGVVAPPVRSGALSIAGGSSNAQFGIRYDQICAPTGRPRDETSVLASIGVILFFYPLSLMMY